MAESRLGKGLSALLGDNDDGDDDAPAKAAAAAGGIKTVPIEYLAANPDQPRRHFDETKLNELAASIRDRGILQPILVRPGKGPKGKSFEIVAGERRWRAAQKARLDAVPIVEKALSDKETFELALIENIQRADLNAIEEAEGFQRLISEHGYKQAELADVIGKSRAHIANTMRLLDLPGKVRALVAKGDLSAGHARALIGLDNALALAELIIAEGLTVREAEARAGMLKDKAGTKQKGGRKSAGSDKDADTLALERDLTNTLGLKVSIADKGGDKGGSISIAYKTLEQLDDLIAKLR